MNRSNKKRVIVYIDGFNLYFGMRDKNLGKYNWLDVYKLGKSLLKKEQQLIRVKHFTARVSGPPDKVKRQNTFLEALETLDKTTIIYGKYFLKEIKCKTCKSIILRFEEKMTDTNMAVEMMLDAHLDRFDTAILISGDTDHVPAINAIKTNWPEKNVVVAFPPGRFNSHLKEIAKPINVWESHLRQSQMPPEVKRGDGYILKRPEEWG